MEEERGGLFFNLVIHTHLAFLPMGISNDLINSLLVVLFISGGGGVFAKD